MSGISLKIAALWPPEPLYWRHYYRFLRALALNKKNPGCKNRFVTVLFLLNAIVAGCAAPFNNSAADKSMNELVFAEGRGSNPDSAGHISRPDRPNIYLLPSPKSLQDFHLTDESGGVFNRVRLMHKWTFIYFGYTNCPDVCPVTTSLLNKVYSSLSQRPQIQSETQVVFISVDPIRDTPRTLGAFIKYFNKDFYAAVGPENELDELTEQLNSKHQILYSEHYLTHEKTIRIMHDSAVYLVDPLARIYAIFTPPFTAEMIKDRYLAILNAVSK